MAGRVLSKTNEDKLRSALKALGEVLSLLDEEESKAKEALKEAANIGHWLESRLHLAFTQLADDMFGEGRLNRSERIALSGALGDALDAFNQVVAERVPGIYKRAPWDEAPEEAEPDLSEAAIEGDFVPLKEQAIRRDGTAQIKIIQPGWGSSGYYPREVLQRDGPQVFRKGLKMYWDHQTPTQEAEQPEGSLDRLAAELVGDAVFLGSGPQGPGLYADAKIFKPYQEAVNELAPHIGVSIRANGRAVPGEAEGRKGPIIQQIVSGKSVDFVTEPGAGGRIIEVFESARQVPFKGNQENDKMNDEFKTRLEETQNALRQLQEENARLREAMTLSAARDFVREALSGVDLPDVTKVRLAGQLAANPVVKDGAIDSEAYAQRIAEAVAAEREYLEKVAGYGSGKISGFGASQGVTEVKADDIAKRMEDAFSRLGLSEAGVKAAVNGRGF